MITAAAPRTRSLHAERVCAQRAQKFTPIRRQVLQALLSSHRPLGAYEVIDELAKSMPRPAPITVYRALDFLMENGLVHRIESRNAFLACAHDHDAAAMVAFLICERCGSVGEIPAAPVAQSLNAAARATGFAPKLSVVEITGTCAHCQRHIITTRRQAGHEDPCRQIKCRSIGRASAQPGRRRVDADAVPELGFQPDRGQAGAAGHSADAAGHDPLRRRAAGAAADRAAARREDCSSATARLAPACSPGVLFGLEFVLIYRGLLLTSASRAVVFLYTAPFFVALGSYQFLGERLRASQWGGLALSFAGVALAIGVPQADVDANVLLGDLLIVGGGALWAATTLVVKATPLLRAPPEKALGYQVALSIPILALAAWISGETLTRVPGPLALSLMAYQAVWVVGLTFLIWFALVKTYSASKLSAFTFITPLFGVVASYFIMHDTLTLAFGAAALLVIAGLYLVNARVRWSRFRLIHC